MTAPATTRAGHLASALVEQYRLNPPIHLRCMKRVRIKVSTTLRWTRRIDEYSVELRRFDSASTEITLLSAARHGYTETQQ